MITQQLWNQLESAAKNVKANAYAPYSAFKVGAAILTASEKIFSGANVENASYGLSSCAERSAVFTAISSGEELIKAVVVFTDTDHPTPPCGACRQVINEFASEDCMVRSICHSSEVIEFLIRDLLPNSFGPKNL